MREKFLRTGLMILVCFPVLGQSSDPPLRFEFADVHATPKGTTLWARNGPVIAGRYELRLAKMVDLIRIAYGVDVDKVLGGPNWLEMDRFDLVARSPDNTPPEVLKEKLATLLAERFGLVVHKDIRPLPTYVLTVGKKPQLSPADGSGGNGCRMSVSEGAVSSLGSGRTVQYRCGNRTMADFVTDLTGMLGTAAGSNPVMDHTGLEGKWNFDFHWALQFNGAMGETVFSALYKQLGLKLEKQPVPTPVIVVDRVQRVPKENPPGTAEGLPVIPRPTEFELADVKSADPESKVSSVQYQPGGRMVVKGMPMQFLLRSSFFNSNSEQVVGAPAWVEFERFDITAQAKPTGFTIRPLDAPTIAPMLRRLLTERFGLRYRTEERQVTAYSLVAGKPKMKKADPASRTWCRQPTAPAGSPPGSQVLSCQNIAMTQLVDELQGRAAELAWPVVDATGIAGGWDFTLAYSQGAAMNSGRGGDMSASVPDGSMTLFEAVEKQLGLKLEIRKRPMEVFVIEHIDRKPTEN